MTKEKKNDEDELDELRKDVLELRVQSYTNFYKELR